MFGDVSIDAFVGAKTKRVYVLWATLLSLMICLTVYLYGLPCIRDISWEKSKVGPFLLLPAMWQPPSYKIQIKHVGTFTAYQKYFLSYEWLVIYTCTYHSEVFRSRIRQNLRRTNWHQLPNSHAARKRIAKVNRRIFNVNSQFLKRFNIRHSNYFSFSKTIDITKTISLF